VLYVTILRSDRSRDPELWATIWQGKAPDTLKIRAVYNLLTDTRVFVWEGETLADARYMDRLNQVGETTTSIAMDQTGGWQQAFAGNLDGMREWFESRGRTGADVDAALDLRRRGHEAPNVEAARRAAREWQEEQRTQGA